jgi:hypothetical protein
MSVVGVHVVQQRGRSVAAHWFSRTAHPALAHSATQIAYFYRGALWGIREKHLVVLKLSVQKFPFWTQFDKATPEMVRISAIN